jgi:hypothetical protein
MSATVYVEKEDADHLRLFNDSGANVAQDEFCVIGGIAAVADEAVVSGAVGSFHIEEGVILQAGSVADCVSGECTFATGGQRVYWNPVSKKFSDTRKPGYLTVGTLTEILASGVIRFAKRFFAEPIMVKCAEITIDAATDYSTTGKSVPIPVGSKIVDVVAICTAAHTGGTAQVMNVAVALHTALVMAVDKTINRMAAAVDDDAMIVGAGAITVKTDAVGAAGIVLVYYI